MIKLGDRVICTESNISGIVIKQYYPTACEEQTMIQCYDGRKYHAPTRTFIKCDECTNMEIDNNPYFNEVGKYAAKLARNHGITVSEALQKPIVKAYAECINSGIIRSAT